MPNDFEVIPLDLYQECIEPQDFDTHLNMLAGNENSVYQYSCEWTTHYPNS